MSVSGYVYVRSQGTPVRSEQRANTVTCTADVVVCRYVQLLPRALSPSVCVCVSSIHHGHLRIYTHTPLRCVKPRPHYRQRISHLVAVHLRVASHVNQLHTLTLVVLGVVARVLHRLCNVCLAVVPVTASTRTLLVVLLPRVKRVVSIPQPDQLLPQVLVLHRLLRRQHKAVQHPFLCVPGEPVNNVATVRVDGEMRKWSCEVAEGPRRRVDEVCRFQRICRGACIDKSLNNRVYDGAHLSTVVRLRLCQRHRTREVARVCQRAVVPAVAGPRLGSSIVSARTVHVDHLESLR
ncbi:ribonuclease H1, putative [Leishmania tarentolae]|uniref:Ribonuclease H1, putative n=1 Tax=Leishmania tarentolae TaxID=5689 RepID=A0A640K8J9_LEITA|nr:ribonuclease H1, putative [Leishmania tarentolae]